MQLYFQIKGILLCLQIFLPGQSPNERQWKGDQHCTALQDGSRLQKISHPPK